MKNTLLAAALLTGFAMSGQTHNYKISGSANNFKKQAQRITSPEKMVSNKAPNFNVAQKQSLNPNAVGWNNFSTSFNIYGVLYSASKPLQYNPNVKAVSFIQRKSSFYTAIPNNGSGAIIAMITSNNGNTWDSTCLYSNSSAPGRYPQGAIYSAPGNTAIANSYVVGSGPALDAGGASWIGSWAASKQLGAGNYNTTASSVPNAMQVLSNTPPYPAFGKQDYATFGFASTNDGAIRSLGIICNDINGATEMRGYMLLKGTFNAGVFTWSGDSITPPAALRTDGTKHLSFTPVMAWSQNGQTGYVIAIGAKAGATGPNKGYQPMIYKTTNAGVSWAAINGIDFSLPYFAPVLNRLTAVNNSSVVVPQFNSLEGIDASVDANGKLHLGTTLVSTASNDIDSLDYSLQFGVDGYQWPHAPGARPYVYDFIGDGTGPWQYTTIDSIGSEGPSDVSGNPGYTENPWDADAGYKVRSDSRIQLSRTPNGDAILFTWAETDSNFTNGQHKWNTAPNLKVRMMKTTGPTAYAVNATEINVTKPSTNINPNVVNRAMFHFASPVSGTLTAGTSNTITLPLTVTNSNPYSQLTDNTHWYYSSDLIFGSAVITAIEQYASASEINSVIYPNPAKNSAVVAVELKNTSDVAVSIYNTIGQLVKTTSAEGQIGENNINIDLSGLATGVYIVNVKVGNTTSTKKLIVE